MKFKAKIGVLESRILYRELISSQCFKAPDVIGGDIKECDLGILCKDMGQH